MIDRAWIFWKGSLMDFGRANRFPPGGPPLVQPTPATYPVNG
jgi:hypothetical protein